MFAALCAASCLRHLQILGQSGSIQIETGVLRARAGLRDTLEPDPDNTGVGSFQGHYVPS